MEITGLRCSHHIAHQSPDTRSPRSLGQHFGACFPLYFGATWLPAVTAVFVSEIVANLVTKSGKVFQPTIISHPTLATTRSTGNQMKGISEALSRTRFC